MIDISELEDNILNSITPAFIALSLLVEDKQVDKKLLKHSKDRLYDIKKYMEKLVNENH